MDHGMNHGVFLKISIPAMRGSRYFFFFFGGGGGGGVSPKTDFSLKLYDTLMSGFQWMLAVYKKSQRCNQEAVSSFRTFTCNSF